MPRTLLSSRTSQSGKLLPRERGFEGRGVSAQSRAVVSRAALRTPAPGAPHHPPGGRAPASGAGCRAAADLTLLASRSPALRAHRRKFVPKFFRRPGVWARGSRVQPSPAPHLRSRGPGPTQRARAFSFTFFSLKITAYVVVLWSETAPQDYITHLGQTLLSDKFWVQILGSAIHQVCNPSN